MPDAGDVIEIVGFAFAVVKLTGDDVVVRPLLSRAVTETEYVPVGHAVVSTLNVALDPFQYELDQAASTLVDPKVDALLV